ncbi:MAG: hypothetical protein LBE92_06395 [Chryseobacterium sp.]|jgi:hypothetical protein|uniref:hypothetical protein n=1 Tax=Chryseobacterium sp. TaxID=1871047 RepID=UPI002822EE48|nr:hypothetical protein [Chryseobacterium sp.]MDR2235734.1 hypothetical protein [Chryseobacterium sp.]
MDKEIKYLNYWSARKRLNSETASVMKWDLWNKTKFKPKVEKGELTSKDIAFQNHNDNLGYEFCAFDKNHTEYPFAYVNIMPQSKHISVEFLDLVGRKYLNYLFGESKRFPDRIFLNEVWYYDFTSETTEEEEYRLHFNFNEDGNVKYTKFNDKIGKSEDFEANQKIDITNLYEDFPNFDEYDKILVEDRIPLEKIMD